MLNNRTNYCAWGKQTRFSTTKASRKNKLNALYLTHDKGTWGRLFTLFVYWRVVFIITLQSWQRTTGRCGPTAAQGVLLPALLRDRQECGAFVRYFLQGEAAKHGRSSRPLLSLRQPWRNDRHRSGMGVEREGRGGGNGAGGLFIHSRGCLSAFAEGVTHRLFTLSRYHCLVSLLLDSVILLNRSHRVCGLF